MPRITDPVRRCLPVAEWPAKDREAHVRAVRPGGLFEEPGRFSLLAPVSLAKYDMAYGRYLSFMLLSEGADTEPGIVLLLTPERLKRFLSRIEREILPYSIYGVISGLHQMGVALAPECDWSWLRTVANRLRRRARRGRPLTGRLVAPHVQFRAGRKLMHDADKAPHLDPKLRAVRFRDGLMLALQAARALRRKNFAQIEVGRHLVRQIDGYLLRFEASEMKNRRPFEIPVPDELTGDIDRYIEQHRPVLASGRDSTALWLAWDGKAMTINSVAARFDKISARHLGKRMGLHLSRHGLATGLACEDPENVRMGAAMLSHASFATTEGSYIVARQIDASRKFRKLIEVPKKRRTRRIR